MNKKEKVCIYGGGVRTKELIKHGFFDAVEIVGIIDSNACENEMLCGYQVLSPDEAHIRYKEVGIIIVTLKSKNACEEVNKIICEKLSGKKVVFLYNHHSDSIIQTINDDSETIVQGLSNKLHKLYMKEKRRCEYREYLECSLDFLDEEDVICNDKLSDDKLYMADYFRYRTFELVLKEIKRKGVSGSAAELGVYKGTFASLINYYFQDRKLFLFDTFTSFSEDEYNKANCDGAVIRDFDKKFRDTSENIVLSKMTNVDNCIVRQGFFPNSIRKEDEDEKFFFVSLDVDLEDSTYEGLKFFVPRMISGGYIFIHDYNDGLLSESVHKAVQKYESEFGISFRCVPIADNSGTLIISF